MATPLHSLFSIWQEINKAVQTSIEQCSVFVRPTTARQFNVNPISASVGTSPRQVLPSYSLLLLTFNKLLSFYCQFFTYIFYTFLTICQLGDSFKYY